MMTAGLRGSLVAVGENHGLSMFEGMMLVIFFSPFFGSFSFIHNLSLPSYSLVSYSEFSRLDCVGLNCLMNVPFYMFGIS